MVAAAMLKFHAAAPASLFTGLPMLPGRLSSFPTLRWRTRPVASSLSLQTDHAVGRRLPKRVRDPKSSANPIPVHGVQSFDVTVDHSRELWFRVFVPAAEAASAASLPVMVFFHGGAFFYYSADSKVYDALCRRLARKLAAVVVSVNYRLCPEHRFPSQYDDGFDVLGFLDGNRRALPENADVTRCFLVGDSAGANVAHHVAVRVSRAGFRVVNVVGLISIQPFFGGEERTESEIQLSHTSIICMPRSDRVWKAFLPEGSNRDHWAANVCGPNALDLSTIEFPHTIVFAAGLDPLQDWQMRYFDWLIRNGKKAEFIEFPNLPHAFVLFPQHPESSLLIAQAKDFVDKRLKNLEFHD